MTPERVFLFGAVAVAALTAVPGYYALTLPWLPGVDFDVTGILWVMQNAPRLFAVVLTGIGLVVTVYFAARSLRG